MSGPMHIMLVAGEPSGDALGARLMAALKLRRRGDVRFSGIGGELMAHQGLHSLFPMVDLSIIGLVEIVPRLPRLLARLAETARAARATRPDAIVTIDSPGFNFRLARRLRDLPVPLVHYVAPTVWAWRRGRARELAHTVDHLLALLPFEPPFFEVEGLSTTFVGHPAIEIGIEGGDGATFRARHGIEALAPLLAVLPGSRLGEVRRHLPIFKQTLALLAPRFPGLRAVVPTLGALAPAVEKAVADWPVPVLALRDQAEKRHAFAAANAALAASGTVTLELNLARVPTVMTYRVNPLTVWILRRMVNVRHYGLVNILMNRAVMPELVQEDCRADLLAEALARIMTDAAARAAQIDAGPEVARLLGAGAEKPSLRAADAVLRAIALGPRRERLGLPKLVRHGEDTP